MAALFMRRRRRLIKEREFRESYDPVTLTDKDFVANFRLTKELFREVSLFSIDTLINMAGMCNVYNFMYNLI